MPLGPSIFGSAKLIVKGPFVSLSYFCKLFLALCALFHGGQAYCYVGFHKEFSLIPNYLYIRSLQREGNITHGNFSLKSSEEHKAQQETSIILEKNDNIPPERDRVRTLDSEESEELSQKEDLTISELLFGLNEHTEGRRRFEVPRTLRIRGSVQSIRRINSQNLYFIDLNDGSAVTDLQLVVNESNHYSDLESLRNGDTISAVGTVDRRRGKESERSLSDFDLYVDYGNPNHKLTVYRSVDADEPSPVLPNIDYSEEYLRKYTHLRFQNKKFSAVMRIRDAMKKYMYDFFEKKGFVGVDTPTLTRMNCENIESLKVKEVNLGEKGKNEVMGSRKKREELNLSPTGQMELEFACYGLGKVWKCSPSFRGETSNTNRHLNEFLMIEAELSNGTIEGMIEMVEELIRGLSTYILTNSLQYVDYLSKYKNDYKEYLHKLSKTRIKVIKYEEALRILNEMLESEGTKVEYEPIEWGKRLTDSQERALVKHFEDQVIAITHYPETITPFYMKLSSNSGDESKVTVENFDVIGPFGFEIAGGSLREHEYENLKRKMEERKVEGEEYERYLELRKYSHMPHGGFGLGFDRLVMLMTMTEHIKDAVPFPITDV